MTVRKRTKIKTCIKNPFLLPLLVAGLGSVLLSQGSAQTFATLYSFTAPPTNSSGVYYDTWTNSDGASPVGGVTLLGHTLYGANQFGGTSADGTVFAVNIDGTEFTNLHSFAEGDGTNPQDNLILFENRLYGTTTLGGNAGQGTAGQGTVFALNTDGTGFTILHEFDEFTSAAGFSSVAGLILSDETLYGTTAFDDDAGGLYGAVFALNTDGSGFTNLHYLTAFKQDTNSDGAFPLGSLVLSSNSTLYGTASKGGTSDMGTLFAVNTDGTGFAVLHTFTDIDGVSPVAGLTLWGQTLYGTAMAGGGFGFGTVFKINTDGTGFTNLYSFSGGSDGAYPQSGLLLSGDTLYGTTRDHAFLVSLGNGTVFALSTDGTSFTTLHSFTGGSDGADPSGLILWGNTLYGTTSGWGSPGWGTVFSISLLPQLTISPAGADVVLTWPTNFTGFTLQSTTNLAASAVWTTNLPAPVIVNGQYTVTNAVIGNQQFFRLSQ